MSPALGHRYYSGTEGGNGLGKAASEQMAARIDDEVTRLIDEAYALAVAVLTDSRRPLDSVAEALLERETLSGAEVESIAGPPPAVPRPGGNGAQPEPGGVAGIARLLR